MSKFNNLKQREYLDLATYVAQFMTLKNNAHSGEIAPHKPIMLMTIMSLIDKGIITKNQITPSAELAQEFKEMWDKYIPNDSHYTAAVWTPFWHMKNEPFWHFKCKKENFKIDSLAEPGQTAKISDIRANVDWVFLDPALFIVLLNKNCRMFLCGALVDTYLKNDVL